MLSNEEAWKQLPPLVQGRRQPLPAWARALAGSLPRTTAAMLELDILHRARSPLPPGLRARLRWVAARANHCRYSQACAEADLHRAGEARVPPGDLDDVIAAAPPQEREVLEFGRKLTSAASTVTDEEVARLIKQHGERPVVAVVLLLAYANFQDRLVLALDLAPEPGGPLPPLEVHFRTALPEEDIGKPRPALPGKAAGVAVPEVAGEWRGVDFEQLQIGLARQRARRARIKLPDATRGGNRWGLVCRTYQPELASAWSACTHAFEAEADPDPILAGSLFWVATRSQGCFY